MLHVDGAVRQGLRRRGRDAGVQGLSPIARMLAVVIASVTPTKEVSNPFASQDLIRAVSESSLRVDGDEDDLGLGAYGGAHVLQRLMDVGHRGRAEIGAVGVAEIHQRGLAGAQCEGLV